MFIGSKYSMSRKRKPFKKPRQYKGYIKFPLYGAETELEFYKSCEYGGDFALPSKRWQIFKRPRKFKVEIWLKLLDENAYEVSELSTPNDLLDEAMLRQLMFDFCVEHLKDTSEYATINIDDSYFKVIL